MTPSIEATRAFVRVALDGQYDLSGEPMSAHAERVARIVRRFNDDHQVEHVALLHDVLEDTNATAQDLLDLGYPPRIVDAVVLLTHDKDELSYERYIHNIAASGNAMAIAVKLADNLDNSAAYRHVKLNPHTSASFLRRYEKAREILAGTSPEIIEEDGEFREWLATSSFA
jgi:(p)ppGpp synthase/HD superfamily hydrolase